MEIQNGLHSLSHRFRTIPIVSQTQKNINLTNTKDFQPLTKHMKLVFIEGEDISIALLRPTHNIKISAASLTVSYVFTCNV